MARHGFYAEATAPELRVVAQQIAFVSSSFDALERSGN